MANRAPVPGCSIDLPPGAGGPFRVFVNGEELGSGEYRQEGNRLVLSRPLIPPRSDGFLRWLTMFTAGIGFYGQGDSVDVHYLDGGGGPGVASNLKVHAPQA
jgi:hypothetical protein